MWGFNRSKKSGKTPRTPFGENITDMKKRKYNQKKSTSCKKTKIKNIYQKNFKKKSKKIKQQKPQKKTAKTGFKILKRFQRFQRFRSRANPPARTFGEKITERQKN